MPFCWHRQCPACACTAARSGSPIVRSIEIQYAGPPSVSKERIIANMRTKVGKLYSEQAVEEDIRNLYNTGNITNVRIFGEKIADGVKVIVVVQTKSTVSEVVFVGVTKLKVTKLRKDMKTKPGSTLNEANLETDRQKILEEYENEGYANTKVDYKVDPNEALGSAKVTFTVSETGRQNIARIDFEGNNSFKPKQLRKAMKMKPRNIISFITKDGRVDNDKIDADVMSLREFYQNHGYVDVDIKQPDVVPIKKDKVALVYHIVEGRQYHVHNVDIVGTAVFPLDQVRAKVKTTTGGGVFAQDGA